MFLSNTGKVYFEGLVQLLRYIRDSKNLGLIYYAKIEDAPLLNLLRQYIIYSENQLVVLSGSICKECTDIGRITGAYIVFYQVGPIDNFTDILGPVAQPSTESEYNVECTTVTVPEQFRILNNEYINNDPDVVP